MVTCYMFRNGIPLEPQAAECLYYYSVAASANAEFKMAKNRSLSTRSKIQKDLWLIVWTGAWQEDISWPLRLEHTSYTLGNIFSYLLLMAAFILGQVPNRGAQRMWEGPKLWAHFVNNTVPACRPACLGAYLTKLCSCHIVVSVSQQPFVQYL